MDKLDEMKAFHAMETIKEAPEFMQDMQLFLLCKIVPGGRMERVARILAKYGMESKKIVPCIMEVMEDFLINKETGEDNVTGQSDKVWERAQEILGRHE